MGRIKWRIKRTFRNLWEKWKWKWIYMKLCWNSLFHNNLMSNSYAVDVLMEPIIWVVDNYSQLLGPFAVAVVFILTTVVVIIAYWIGLPYWWEKSQGLTIGLVIFGNWLLVNVVFNYVMGIITPAGYPPEGAFLTEAVSFCKKCLSPKPPRTHHCSVCNRCILKMDHHCPWMNNCVGFANHRYFFLYMVYTTIGCLFLIVFGFEIAYKYYFLESNDVWSETEPLQGQPVKFNLSGHIIPVTHHDEYDESLLPAEHNLPTPDIKNDMINHYRKQALWFMAIVNVAFVVAVGSLCTWHARLITKGETSIEAHINAAEAVRAKKEGKIYVNPYDFGAKNNWKIFLGLVRGRKFWRTVLLPSWHPPEGTGLKFLTIHEVNERRQWP